jgi:putative ABC transport system ATP-binding protein
LRQLELQADKGEFIALIGESGGGKSTLLNLIAGLDDPSEGSITLDGEVLQSLNEAQRTQLRRTKIGFVFQAFHLLNHLSTWQNIALPLLLNGTEAQQAKQRALTACEQLGLSHRADAQVPQLSGGEQQRVALARALIHNPSLVLADEPTGNLDPGNAQPALALLREHCSKSGATVLMVTHSVQAASFADRTLRLQQGRLVA